MKPFWIFARRMLRHRRLLALCLAATLINAACALGGFGALGMLINKLFADGRTVHEIVKAKLAAVAFLGMEMELSPLAAVVPTDPLLGFCFALAVVFSMTIVGSLMRYLYQIGVFTVCLRTVAEIRRDAFARLIQVPMQIIGQENTADQMSRILHDCALLGRGFNALIAKSVRQIVLGVTFLAAAVVINWQLTIIFLLGLPVIYYAIRKIGKIVRRASKYALRAQGRMTGMINQALLGLAVVKVHGGEGRERRRFNRINRVLLAEEMKGRNARAMSGPIVETLAVFGVIVVAMVAAWLTFKPGGNPADMVWVLGALGLSGASLRPVANLNNELQEATAAAVRIQQVLDLQVEPTGRATKDQPPSATLPRHQRAIEFQQVTFAYPGTNDPAVNDVNLDLAFGTTVAIVGPNGSGKSTLVSMIPRLLVPDAGHVLIDDVDIQSVTLRSLRSQISLVTQQSVLFEDTIAGNIAYGQVASRQQVIAAAKQAHAHEFIETLPDGYDTMLGESGSGLSGGQRQRICIARALLRDAAILILDEATSQVDAHCEAAINEVLAQETGKRTTIVIAHRLSTVVEADMIVVMDQGRIVAKGTHDQLLANNDVYQRLSRTQLASRKPENNDKTQSPASDNTPFAT